MAGDQRGDAERERDRHRDEADVERRRMNRHVEVLQERIQPGTVRRWRRQERRERVLVDDHQEDEEHLRGGNHRDDVRNQFAVTDAIDLDGDRAERGQQQDPEHDRAVEPAPVRRDLVGERLRRVRIALDVFDRVVVGDKRVDENARGKRHQRGDGVEGADAAFDQPVGPGAGAGDAGRKRKCRDDERGKQDERAKGRHGLGSGNAGRPLGLVFRRALRHHAVVIRRRSRRGPSVPLRTTSDPPLNVSGTTPV